MFNRFYLPAIAWFIISTILLTLPGSAFPKEDWFSKLQVDKWVHIVMFGLMSFLFCLAIFKQNIPPQKIKTYFIIAAFMCVVYGILMEFVQDNFIPNRSFDLGDIAADAIGSGLGLFYSIRRYIKR